MYIYIVRERNIISVGMKEEKGCDINRTVKCPRCSHEFKPDSELLEEYDTKKETHEELNVLASCPICGNKTRLGF